MSSWRFLFFTILFCCYVNCQAYVDVYVSSTASDGVGASGSIDSPYPSIQFALESTSGNLGVHDVLRINMLSGQYTQENDTLTQINDRYVEIRANEPDTVSFSCSRSQTEAVFTLSGEGSFSLDGVTIQQCSSVINYPRNDLLSASSFPVNVTNCLFDSITGSAVSLQNNNHLYFTNTQVTNNRGYILFFNGIMSTAHISNCHFENSLKGVYTTNVEVTVDDTTFENISDTALFMNPIPYSIDSITNTKFINTVASYSGGSIYTVLTKSNANAELHITNCQFVNNTASIGGAIYAGANYEHSSNNTLTVQLNHCTFSLCKASNGGVIYLSSTRAVVLNSTFADNSAGQSNDFYLDQEATIGVYSSDTFDENSITCVNSKCSTDNTDLAASQYCSCVISTEHSHDKTQQFSNMLLDIFLISGGTTVILVVVAAVVFAAWWFYKKHRETEFVGADEGEEFEEYEYDDDDVFSLDDGNEDKDL